MFVKPKIVYKYKSLAACNSFCYLIDTVKNKRIYLPKPSEVNDPLEACAVQLHLSYAGSSYGSPGGRISGLIEEKRNEFKVLSFSSIPNSSVMWADYADDSAGCCLMFRTKHSLDNIKPVIYTDSIFEYDEADFEDHDITEYVEDAFLFKMKDWSYENEWRYIEKTDSQFLGLEEGELCGIILGRKIDACKANILLDACKETGIPCYRSYVLQSRNQLVVIPNIEGKEEYFTSRDMHGYIENEALSDIERENAYLMHDYLMNPET